MSSPYMGEIRMFGGTFAIRGWAFCNGAQLPISQYEALYTLIGTTYGGDGVNFFNLPDLRSRVPVGSGQGPGLQTYPLGQQAGVETVTLATGNLPAHNHGAGAQSAGGDNNAPGANTPAWALASGNSRYTTDAPTGAMNSGTIGFTGGNQSHDNMLPVQCINYIIALDGIYPPRN